MIWPFNKKSQRQLDHERWAEEDRQKQIGRARRIELWASRKLDEAKLGGPHYAVKDQILVSKVHDGVHPLLGDYKRVPFDVAGTITGRLTRSEPEMQELGGDPSTKKEDPNA